MKTSNGYLVCTKNCSGAICSNSGGHDGTSHCTNNCDGHHYSVCACNGCDNYVSSMSNSYCDACESAKCSHGTCETHYPHSHCPCDGCDYACLDQDSGWCGSCAPCTHYDENGNEDCGVCLNHYPHGHCDCCGAQISVNSALCTDCANAGI